MSFILDALKKSETDRQRQTSPALFEVKVAAPRRRLPLWAVGLAVLFVINVAALAWLVLRAPASAPAQSAANAPAGGANTAVAALPAPASAPPGMVTVPATVTIPTTVNIPAGSAPTIVIGSHDAQAGAVAPSGTPPLVEEPMLSGHEPSVSPDFDAGDYAEAVTPAEAQTAATAAAAARWAGAGGLPSRDDVVARGTPLPELRLDMHVYDAIPAKRFVFLNMSKLREGESLPDGTRVEQISQHGVQLWYRGTRFTIAGN
jgi:general secretion pathway protein B